MTRSVASRSLLVACSTASVLFFPARFALVPADIAFPTPDNAALKPMAAIPTEVSALASTMAEGAAATREEASDTSPATRVPIVDATIDRTGPTVYPTRTSD